LPGPDEAAHTAEALIEAGVPAEDVLACAARRALGAWTAQDGITGSRAVWYERCRPSPAYGDMIHDDEAHLEAGRVPISAPARHGDERERVQGVLREQGPRRMRYFGNTTFVDIG
jgi:hypothetical protein